MTYEQHPLGKLLPPLTVEEYKNLKDSIQEFGQKQRIKIFEDQVLDGWHRYRACKELNIKPRLRHVRGSRSFAVEEIMVSITHRHLNPSQYACIAANLQQEMVKARTWTRNPGGYNQVNLTPGPTKRDPTTKSSYAAAKIFGISGRLVEKAVTVKKRNPKLFDQVFKGGKTRIETAWQQVKSEGPKKFQAIQSVEDLLTFHKDLTKNNFEVVIRGRVNGSWACRYHKVNSNLKIAFAPSDYHWDLKLALVKAGKLALKAA